MSEPLVARLRAAGCVFAEEEAALLRSAAAGAALEALVARRVAGEPLEYVLGWAEFRGRRLAVAAGVFVPRRRTELLAALAAAALPAPGVLVELCCGVAPVAATVDAADAYGCDVDPAAVDCARRNLAADRVFLGDLYDPLPASLRGRIDVLVANAPYVPSDEVELMPREARLYEHRVALDGGTDGLAIQRRIAAGARGWLAPGGTLIVETSRHQAADSAAILGAAGFRAEIVTDDDLDATALLARNEW